MRRNFSALLGALVWGLYITAPAAGITLNLAAVGNPGNAPDTRYNGISVGKVDYAYAIGKYDVSAGEYSAFLNAVAKTDAYGLYNPLMDCTANPNNQGCNIKRSGTAGNYVYSVAADWANRPVNYVSWGDAARFCNWLQNGQPTGAQGLSTTEDGTYYLNGATSNAALMAVTRKAGAEWWLPSENEWYKAAYYDPILASGAGGYWDYATRSNASPSSLLSATVANHANYGGTTLGSSYWRSEVGAFAASPSAYGTFDQAGNVWEWDEANVAGARGERAGGFGSPAYKLAASYRVADSPANEAASVGFRICGLHQNANAVPEPGSIVLLLAVGLTTLVYRGRTRV
jgi:formylglycine-generating enzyme